MIQARRLTLPSCQCIHFVDVTSEPPLEELGAAGVHVATIDVAAVRGKQAFVEMLARELRFPSYFGGNWDAVEECIRDMSWLPAKGYVIWLTGSTSLWREQTGIAGTFLEIALGAAEAWAERQISFHVVFHG